MLPTCRLLLLLGALTLALLGPARGASPLGLAVYAVPQDSAGGETVLAYFTAIAPSPCPALSGLCAAGEDCQVYPSSLPFTGMLPSPGWCVRQWQKVVPSNYNAVITLGSNTDIYVWMKAGPTVRANTGKLNQPPYVALPPPLRARANCPHDFFLSVKDLDGDRVRCRFARPEECGGCEQHSFLEIDEELCMVTFTGRAQAGQYVIYLMAEDFIPSPKVRTVTDSSPLSSIPVQLILTVEKSNTLCSDEPLVYEETPKGASTLFVLPYQEVAFNVTGNSQSESVSEIAVVGPPGLFRTVLKGVGPLATMTMAWVRADNALARLLPICYVVNTINLQSEPRCVWLYQRQMKTLPAGTELSCQKTEMLLVLPVTSLNVNLAELQLNSATCPITYNSTHLTAHISLSGCGTKAVQAGSELVYTNTLRSVHPYSVISRKPSLILPLACRIPGIQVKAPQYNVSIPTEKEAFGEFAFQLEIYFPGEGPLSKFTRNPTFRSLLPSARRRREAVSPSGGSGAIGSTGNSSADSRIKQLDLYVSSNCSVAKAELIVSQCIQSDTEDFTVNTPILQQGCFASNSTVEILTPQTNVKIYRLDLSSLAPKESVMYVQCIVNLCITTSPSLTCPDLCNRASSAGSLVNSLFTKSYTVTSKAISLVPTTPASPTTGSATAAAPTASSAITTATATQGNAPSYAPERASGLTAAAILTTLSVFLQNVFFY